MSDPTAKPATSSKAPEAEASTATPTPTPAPASASVSASATAAKTPEPTPAPAPAPAPAAATTAAPAQTTAATTSAGTTAAGTTVASPETTETTAPTDAPEPAGEGIGGILPASHWAQAAPVHDDDDDSAFEDDIQSSTASLSSSILHYRTINGRTFHSERGNASSWSPNDEPYNESMEILHHASTLMQDGKLALAPITDSVQDVLDVGCGPGIWAIDFADHYPGAQVIGVDVSPTQPQWIPPNLRFEVDDMTQPWTYRPESFDYIHMRWLVGHIEDWYFLFKEVFKALKPGGYFESKESTAVIHSDDGSVTEDSALSQWGRVFSEYGRRNNRTFEVIEKEIQKKAMREAGFVDIEEHDFKAPLGSWPADEKTKELGQFVQLSLSGDIEGFLVKTWSEVLGWTMDEIHVYAAHLRRELRSRSIHSYYDMKVVIGRKPNVGEVS